MLSRRQFLSFCGKLCLTIGLGSLFPRIAAAAETQDGHPLLTEAEYIRQLVTKDSRSSRIIMWQSSSLLPDPRLEIHDLQGKNFISPEISYQYQEQQGVPYFFYHTELTGLSPDTRYEFRLVSGDRATEWQPVLPASSDKFQMLIFCDTQCVYYDVWKDVCETACHRHPEATLATVIGDLVDNGQMSYQWEEWFRCARELLNTRIFAAVMGNHECYSPIWQMCLPEGYLARFHHPFNGSPKFFGYYYSFDYGPVHFIVLNSQFDELDGLTNGLLENQISWLKQDVQENRKPWKVVLMHKDVLAYENLGPGKGQCYINDIGQKFMDTFDECSIDLVLTGHEHTYRNRHHIFDGKPSDHGPVYVLCGLAGDQRYPGIWIDPVFDKVTAPQPETDNYLTLDADKDSLRLRCYLMDGTVIDDMTLQHAQQKTGLASSVAI